MRVTLIQAAYALGRADVEPAMGPIAILRAGAADTLRSAGHDVEVETVEVGDVIALDALRERVTDVHLHLDLDVLDPSEGTVNLYAAEGGPSASDVAAAIKAVGERFRIRAAAVTAYDPGADPEGRVPPTAVRLLVEIAAAVARERAVTA